LKYQMLYAILNIKKDTCWNRCLSVRIVSIPKVDAPKYAFCSYEHSLTCLPTGKAFLFLLIISLIEKGKKRNNQTTKRHQQS